MISEGTVVKGNIDDQTISGVITKTKTHKRKISGTGANVESEITLVEVIFQKEGHERAIYAYAENEFYIIKPAKYAPVGLELA